MYCLRILKSLNSTNRYVWIEPQRYTLTNFCRLFVCRGVQDCTKVFHFRTKFPWLRFFFSSSTDNAKKEGDLACWYDTACLFNIIVLFTVVFILTSRNNSLVIPLSMTLFLSTQIINMSNVLVFGWDLKYTMSVRHAKYDNEGGSTLLKL